MLVDKFSVQVRRVVRRGDVVLLVAPDDPRVLMVKRVVGLPGDELRLATGTGAGGGGGADGPVAEAAGRSGGGGGSGEPQAAAAPTTVVPAGHFWVEGDNSASSTDSATRYGAVPLGLLQGRVMGVVWPPSRMARIAPREAPAARFARRGDDGERALSGGRHEPQRY